MREAIKEFVRVVAGSLPTAQPVYEFGSFQVSGQEGFADLRPFFAGKTYVGCDMREGPGVDRIVNLHDIDLPAETAGTALALDTLEHVEYPRKATQELHRILRPGGLLVISSVMKFPIHDYPYDYWRFTPEGFRSLLNPFDAAFVDIAGDDDWPHTVIGLGFKGQIPQDAMNDFMRQFEAWKRHWRKPPGKMKRSLHKLITRPGDVKLVRRVKQAWSGN